MVINDINNKEAIIEEFFNNGLVLIQTSLKNINPTVIKNIGSYFGKLLITGKHHVHGDRHVQVISEDELFGNKLVPWHNDFSYSVGDYHGTLLAFIDSDVPTYTEFADCNQIYNMLPKEQQDYLEGVEATFGIPQAYDGLIYETQVKVIQKYTMKRPVAMTHPITKNKSLYFSPETLMETTKPIDKEKFVSYCDQLAFKHHWNKGDILLWDNRRMLHRRPAFAGHRELLRVNFQYEFGN